MKTRNKSTMAVSCSLFLILALAGVQDLNAQFWKKKKVAVSGKQAFSKKIKSIKELTRGSREIQGLFTIYQDTVTGSLQLLIKKTQLNKDFIYFSQIANGVVEAGQFRGAYKGSAIIQVKKYFNRLEFVAPNTSFYFDDDSAISKSSEANISNAVMASGKIVALDEEKGLYLIAADALFLSETFTRIKSPKLPGQSPLAFSLGSFDKDKSKIEEIRNYPENTNVKTTYVYTNPAVLNGGGKSVTDGRNVSIGVFHTFMNMPEDNYKTRLDDARVGYFATETNDMTSTEVVNYRDFIHRWKLVKKNENASISDPISPIIWWIENTTPKEFIETIKEGVLAWNEAFEKSGFTNAMVVKLQPDDADWDAGDVRYNVLRWTSSPNPPFGGYGPSFVNPRTGEILGADIMLEYVHFTNRVYYDRVFTSASSMDLKILSEDEEKLKLFKNKENYLYCSKGLLMQENMVFGQTVLAAVGASELEMEGMKKEGMKSLIMHEIGHTLGLNHNMKASQLFSPEQLADANFIKGKALTGSVMDYAGINLTLDRTKQGQYYDMAVGPYDVWAIQFGYTPFNTDAEKNTLLAKSTNSELIFGNDADDMRSPGKGIDPRVMIGDLSNDQIRYATDRILLVNQMMKEIKFRFGVSGESYMELRQAYYILSGQAATAANVISRFIGGVYVDRATPNQEPGVPPFMPVRLEDQKRAMDALQKYVFAPDAFAAPSDLYNHLSKQRRGYNFFSGPEDPKIHEQVLSYQTSVLAHIMHPNTLQRISNSELYGNEYSLSLFMTDLNGAIFKADISGTVNSFRQNLQVAYTKGLIGVLFGAVSSRYSAAARSMAIYNLNRIKSLALNTNGNIASRAHKEYLNILITNALKEIK